MFTNIIMSIFCVKLHIYIYIYIYIFFFTYKLIIKEKHAFDLSGGWPFSGMGIVWETYFNKGVPCPWGSLKIPLNQGDKPWIFWDPRRFRCHFGTLRRPCANSSLEFGSLCWEDMRHLEPESQPVLNGWKCRISTHFSSKGLVHHPIEPTIKKWVLGYQACKRSYISGKLKMRDFLSYSYLLPKIDIHGHKNGTVSNLDDVSHWTIIPWKNGWTSHFHPLKSSWPLGTS